MTRQTEDKIVSCKLDCQQILSFFITGMDLSIEYNSLSPAFPPQDKPIIASFYPQEMNMPIYEFHCEDCGKTFESLVLIASAVDELTCKYCNSSNIKKLISTTSQPAKGSPIPAGALSGCSSRSGFS